MKKLISIIFLTVILVSAAISAFALDSHYKNNLLNVELTQMPDNRVSVLLVFEKPYKDAIKVIYKTDNEYNILLPETYHSMTSISSINALNVRSANVKLVPYFNQDSANGYTKITIKTTRPVIFNAHASYVTTKLANEDTLLEKLKREEEFKIKPTTLPQQGATQKTTKTTQTKPTVSKPKVQTPAAKPAAKTAKPTYKKPAQVKPKTVQKKTVTKPVTKTAKKPAPKVQPKVQSKPQTQVKQPAKPVKAVPKTQPQESAKKPPVTVEPTPVIPVTPVEPKVEPQIPTPTSETFIQKTINKISQLSSQYGPGVLAGLAGLLLLGMLLKLLGSTTKRYASLYSKKAQPIEVDETVDVPKDLQNMEKLSWQEKYKRMKQHEEDMQEAATAAQEKTLAENIEKIYADAFSEQPKEQSLHSISEPEVSQPETQPENIDLYEPHTEMHIADEVTAASTYSEPIYQEPETVLGTEESFEAFVTSETDNTFESLENLDDLSDISPEIEGEVSPENLYESEPQLDINIAEPLPDGTLAPQEPVLINQAKISKTKGFYLIRYENEVALVGYIKDKIFLLQTFTDMEQSFVQTRLTEKKRGEDIYLVRSDGYKALVGVSKDEMKTIIKL